MEGVIADIGTLTKNAEGVESEGIKDFMDENLDVIKQVATSTEVFKDSAASKKLVEVRHNWWIKEPDGNIWKKMKIRF